MKVVNNTNEKKHLPYGGVIEPGEDEISESQFEANKGHPGFDADIKEGRLDFPALNESKEDKIKPQGVVEMTVSEARPVIRTIEDKTVLQGIINLEKEQEARDSIYKAVDKQLDKLGE